MRVIGNSLEIKYVREGEEHSTNLSPAKTKENEYKLGLWVRDAAAGVGTISFYEPETGNFAALGHGIMDIDTSKLINISKGELVTSKIISIVKGENVPEPGVPESFKVLVKELQSLGLDVRLYSEDNQELELKENIEEGIEYDPSKEKKLLSEDEIIEQGDLVDGYLEENDEEMILDEESNDELFEALGDEGEELLFDSDLANDNIDNDEDIIE